MNNTLNTKLEEILKKLQEIQVNLDKLLNELTVRGEA